MANLLRAAKNFGKRGLSNLMELGQKMGVDVLPRHFYSEIPNIPALREDQSWRKPYSMTGVAGAEPELQLETLKELMSPSICEALNTKDINEEAAQRNGEFGFGPVEADVLYAFVRTHRPPRIVQIGAGFSTAVCLIAAEDEGYTPKITCIDPYPTQFLCDLSEEGRISVIEERVQDTKVDLTELVSAGDFFFVDSSHTLGPAGECSRTILEMLPRLPDGAFAHFHDIWFPFDYSPTILSGELFFWHESVLLHAFLSGNNRFRIYLSLSLLHHNRQEDLKKTLPNYEPCDNEMGLKRGPGDFPCSIYLKVEG